MGVGDDEGQVGPMLGELLDRPHAGAVAELDAGRGTASPRIATSKAPSRSSKGDLPAVIAWDKGKQQPRYPSLRGIMAAKKKPLAVKTAAELGLTLSGSRRRPRGARGCRRRARRDGCSTETLGEAASDVGALCFAKKRR